MNSEIKGNAGSPNYCWLKAGYRIERTKRKNHYSFHRKIYNKNGDLVIEKGTHESEMAKIHELGIYSD